MSADAKPRLERSLNLRDLVLFNLVAVIGITWVATAAKAGPSSLTLWLLAALLFFIPQGLAVIQLSTSYPDEGGIYAWTKREFREGHGFLCGWPTSWAARGGGGWAPAAAFLLTIGRVGGALSLPARFGLPLAGEEDKLSRSAAWPFPQSVET